MKTEAGIRQAFELLATQIEDNDFDMLIDNLGFNVYTRRLVAEWTMNHYDEVATFFAVLALA